MSKNSRDHIDLDEKKVLSELMKNSKENIETIGKKCDFSRQKVWRIVKNLEEKHIIWGYTAIFDEKKIDLMHFMIMIKKSTKKLEQKTIDIIVSRELEGLGAELGISIESSAYTHGDYDWVITFTAEDLRHAKKFSNSLIALHPGIIEKITIIQTLMFIKKQYVINPEKIKLREFL